MGEITTKKKDKRAQKRQKNPPALGGAGGYFISVGLFLLFFGFAGVGSAAAS